MLTPTSTPKEKAKFAKNLDARLNDLCKDIIKAHNTCLNINYFNAKKRDALLQVMVKLKDRKNEFMKDVKSLPFLEEAVSRP